MKKWIAAGVLAACVAGAFAWFPSDEKGAKPLVCEQITPTLKYAKTCSSQELQRMMAAGRWVAENTSASLTASTLAAAASFIEDTGRSYRTTFYQRLKRNDVDGACEAMLRHVHRRGEIDQERVERRKKERAMCLTKG